MNPRFKSLVGLQAVVAVVAFAIPLLVASELRDSPPPIEVWVEGQPRYIPPGITFGDVLQQDKVRATDGDLLDVEGKVLQRGAFPGRVELNGVVAVRSTKLSDGDRIAVLDEHDRREMIDVQVIHLKGRRPSDPQFSLGTAPGEQIVKTGRVSGKLASSVFQPTGPSHFPRAVALTFDDGPDPPTTLKILRVLKQLHARATFFTIGYLAQRYPQVIRKEVGAGMVVADHTWNHPNSPAFRKLSSHRIEDEILAAKLQLQELGVTPRLFRPVGGSFSPEIVETAQRLGMRVVLWSVDPEDWRAGISWKQIVRNVLSNVRRGSIVILHDGGGDQMATVRALPRIIHGLRRKHLRIVPIR